MEFLGNKYDTNRPDAYVNFERSKEAFFDRNLDNQEWASHLKWLQDKIISRPKATDHFTTEQLENMGMVGVYKESLPTPKQSPVLFDAKSLIRALKAQRKI
jgi:hypothetical protein